MVSKRRSRTIKKNTTKNINTRKETQTLQLKRSERIIRQLKRKQGEVVPDLNFDLVDENTKIKSKAIVKVKTENIPMKKNMFSEMTLSTATNKSLDVKAKRAKFYTDIARDEQYREKVNSNPNAYNKDMFGNLAGNQFDLAIDNAFGGFLIAILQFYYEPAFNFKDPGNALTEKGFRIHRWTGLPVINEFKQVLLNSCQLWIISHSISQVDSEYLEVIKNFFDSGKGVYIWGDNKPYYADANKVSKYLFGAEMYGNVPGNQTVYIQKEPKKRGFVKEHLISTGLDSVFEGATIATIKDNELLEPVLYGSADNLVIASYNRDGKRALIDGGFTRLYHSWNTAGTGRYIKNAAAWLANIENIPI